MNFLKSSGFKIGIIIALLLAVITPQTNYVGANTAPEYSGEELYKGIIFGQGEFGKEIITNQEEYEKMNNKESIEFSNNFVDFIKEKNPTYFDELQKSIYDKDATLSLNMLETSGKYFDEYIEGFEVEEQGPSSRACGIVAVCGAAVVLGAYNYVVVVQAVAAVQVGVAAWALKTKAVSNVSTRSMNADPEAEMASVLNSL